MPSGRQPKDYWRGEERRREGRRGSRETVVFAVVVVTVAVAGDEGCFGFLMVGGVRVLWFCVVVCVFAVVAMASYVTMAIGNNCTGDSDTASVSTLDKEDCKSNQRSTA